MFKKTQQPMAQWWEKVVSVFLSFSLFCFFAAMRFSWISILNFSCILLFLVSKCDIFNKWKKIFHYVNEIFKQIESLYLCLIRILEKKKKSNLNCGISFKY